MLAFKFIFILIGLICLSRAHDDLKLSIEATKKAEFDANFTQLAGDGAIVGPCNEFTNPNGTRNC